MDVCACGCQDTDSEPPPHSPMPSTITVGLGRHLHLPQVSLVIVIVIIVVQVKVIRAGGGGVLEGGVDVAADMVVLQPEISKTRVLIMRPWLVLTPMDGLNPSMTQWHICYGLTPGNIAPHSSSPILAAILNFLVTMATTNLVANCQKMKSILYYLGTCMNKFISLVCL
jgi:hypothetical protein